MKLMIGGVRGSCPVAQPDFMTYGGETTAFLIESEAGEHILIDGGTGIRQLGRYLMKTARNKSAWLFMTHYHLDHVVGLPMLPMIYSSDWDLHIAAPDHNEVHMREIMARIFDRPLWPLQVEDLRSGNFYHQLDGLASTSPFQCGTIEVRWCPLNHPGGSTAYRFDEPSTGASVVIATDVEWGASDADERKYLERLIAHPSPANLLIMDGQYDDAEIAKYRGWGHSSWQQVVELAARMKVQRALITHHDPNSDDEKLEKLNRLIRAQTPWVGMARQDTTITLPIGQADAQQ